MHPNDCGNWPYDTDVALGWKMLKYSLNAVANCTALNCVHHYMYVWCLVCGSCPSGDLSTGVYNDCVMVLFCLLSLACTLVSAVCHHGDQNKFSPALITQTGAAAWHYRLVKKYTEERELEWAWGEKSGSIWKIWECASHSGWDQIAVITLWLW